MEYTGTLVLNGREVDFVSHSPMGRVAKMYVTIRDTALFSRSFLRYTSATRTARLVMNSRRANSTRTEEIMPFVRIRPTSDGIFAQTYRMCRNISAR